MKKALSIAFDLILIIIFNVGVFLAVPAQDALASFDYDGTDDSHVANNPNAGSASTYTVCGWIYLNTCNDGDVLFGYGNGKDSSAGRGWELAFTSGCGIRWDNYEGVNAYNDFYASTLSTATQYHICFVREDTWNNKIYIDATDSTADDTLIIDPPTVQNSTDDFKLGETLDNHTGFGRTNFDGKLAHVAYWTSALSGAQVASMANKSTCPSDVDSANLKVFLPGTADPMTEDAQSLTVTTNSAPVFTSNDPTGLPCGGGGGGAAERRRRNNPGAQ